jgi:spore germination cell wall hydrolase CwlJ-like protein
MIAETCLALAIYWEARNQPLQGKLAVAEVVLHRAHSELFPNDVCSVVYQGLHRWSNPVRNRCQFRGIVTVNQTIQKII